MYPFIKNFEGAINTADISISDIFDNKYFYIISVVLLLLLGSLNSTLINKNIFYLYDNVFTRLFLLGIIYYISTKNAPLAILLIAAILVSMNTYNKYKFNLLLMSHLNKNNYSDFMFYKLMKKIRSLKKEIRKITTHKRQSKINSLKILKKIDSLRRNTIKKLFSSIKIIMDSLAGSNKVPSKLTTLALKAKKIATSLKEKTPKIVKDVAKKIKNIAISKGITIPKIVSKLSSTVGLNINPVSSVASPSSSVITPTKSVSSPSSSVVSK